MHTDIPTYIHSLHAYRGIHPMGNEAEIFIIAILGRKFKF